MFKYNLYSYFRSGFMEDSPEGKLTKGKLIKMYSSVLTVEKAAIFVDQIFSTFDTDNNGNIDFKVATRPPA